MSDRDLIPNEELVQWLDRQDGWFVAGSSAIPDCGSNDLDIVVLVGDYKGARNTHPDFLCEVDSSAYTALQPNICLRAPGIDLIVTERYDTFVLWHKATLICKELRLIRRDDRLKVHHILLERAGEYTDPPHRCPLRCLI